jgi:3-oxoisoapionate decarboxylase
MWTLPRLPHSLSSTCATPLDRKSSVTQDPQKLPRVGPAAFVNASWGWREVPLPEYFAWSATHGLPRVEINAHPLSPEHLLHAQDPAVLSRIQSWAEEAGVQIVCVAGHNDFTSPDEDAQRAQLARARFFVDAAQALDAPFVRLLSGGHRVDPLSAEVFPRLHRAFTEIGRYAEGRGVRIVIENHGGPTATGQRIARIMEGVASPAVGLNYDPANFLFQGTDPLMALRYTLPWVIYSHWKDVRWENGGPRLCPLGEGEIQWEPIVRTLLEAGYRGYWGIEHEEPSDIARGTLIGHAKLRALVGGA